MNTSVLFEINNNIGFITKELFCNKEFVFDLLFDIVGFINGNEFC